MRKAAQIDEFSQSEHTELRKQSRPGPRSPPLKLPFSVRTFSPQGSPTLTASRTGSLSLVLHFIQWNNTTSFFMSVCFHLIPVCDSHPTCVAASWSFSLLFSIPLCGYNTVSFIHSTVNGHLVDFLFGAIAKWCCWEHSSSCFLHAFVDIHLGG